ncbi:DHHC-type zinc finger domain-containing protein [Encephalitozoon romaleae SJ-2008]|uniref:Palmitoyltransferase n=1 Tax=Encephalitozoon romaleae (strain SJ-2008) TaxID=1178016 RepID=I7AP29_ENCRO|nr:DHHC-type zinc finger domain-containing protein [Encephalitozoon romaleae SJ-2008]AFN83559.1 DHHC-type zinc finger domain-containing protein [Encephalitozoon romaleae SJ-2008]
MSSKPRGSFEDQFRIKFVMFIHIKMYTGVLLYRLLFTRSLYGSSLLGLLVVASSLSFLKACLTDPGKVNRKVYHKYIPDMIVFEEGVSTQIRTNRNGDWIRAIRINGTEYQEKYCLECNLFRINGMSHCRECNRCVLDMDHHCIWFGNCIGRNNIRYFHIYLYTLSIVTFINAAFMYGLVIICSRNTLLMLALRILAAAFGALYTLFFCIIFLFTMFNIYVALNSSTSRDFIKNGTGNKKLDIGKACKNLSRLKPSLSFDLPSV